MTDDVRARLAHRPGEHALDLGRQLGSAGLDATVDSRGGEGRAGALERLGERAPTVPLQRLAHLAQRLPRHALHFLQLGLRARRITLDELHRQLALERDQRERVAEQVVQVARDPHSLLGDGGPGELLARGTKLPVRPYRAPERRHHRPDGNHRERVRGDGRAVRPRCGEPCAHRSCGDGDHRHGRPGRQQHRGRRDDVDEQDRERARSSQCDQQHRDRGKQSERASDRSLSPARERTSRRQQRQVEGHEGGQPDPDHRDSRRRLGGLGEIRDRPDQEEQAEQQPRTDPDAMHPRLRCGIALDADHTIIVPDRRSAITGRLRFRRRHGVPGASPAKPMITTTAVTKCRQMRATELAPSASQAGPTIETASAVEPTNVHRARGCRLQRSSSHTTDHPASAPATAATNTSTGPHGAGSHRDDEVDPDQPDERPGGERCDRREDDGADAAMSAIGHGFSLALGGWSVWARPTVMFQNGLRLR